MSERDTQGRILLAASEMGYTLWRQNVGMGWAGDAERLPDGSILLRNPRPLHAGLCKGSSDLIGLLPVTITEAHIGRIMARFTAFEVKGPQGRTSDSQERFLRFVAMSGGIAAVARSPADLPETCP